ncbi:MAG: hypothetical protein WD533_03720 [Dehalococcoidia bacterium]
MVIAVDEAGDVTAIEFMGEVRERFAPLIDYFLAEQREQQTRRAS